MKNTEVKLTPAEREKKVNELLTRSVQAVLPSKEGLKELLLSGKKLRVYIGADATGPDLHLGHSTNYLLLEAFRELGHETIVLFGDFTAMIGDPTDKSEGARKPLTSDDVSKNIKTWKKQLTPIVGFTSKKNPTTVVKNSKWLSKLSFSDVVKLASNFTVQQMLERDMFEKRMNSQKPIHLHEFLYPLMQGFDSVALDVDVEIGGNDQTFNMMAGRILQKNYNSKEKFVVATTLLANPKTGKKLMSKSEGGYISLQDDPRNMFGKVMALPDETIRQVFIDCTKLSLKEIEEIIEAKENPRDQKILLAKEIVSMYYGAEKAEAEVKAFLDIFSARKVISDVPEIKAEKAVLLSDTFMQNGIVNSKSEFTRLLKEGAITEMESNKKITDLFAKSEPGTYKIGKHRFIKLI